MAYHLDHHHWVHRRRHREWSHSGPNEPSAGLVMTALLGIVRAFVATDLVNSSAGTCPNDGAVFIASIVGAVIVLALSGA